MIPLISSISYGPLEALQLPRTWWKVLTRNVGILDAEYPDCSPGLDAKVIEALGLDQEAVLTYLRENMPDYLTFEAWVVEQCGGAIDRAAADAWNESVHNRQHAQHKIEETYNDIGWDAANVDVTSAYILNANQDWQLFHQRDLDADYGRLGDQVPPLVSNIDFGRLGVCQLPRTWYKILMRSKNLLHPDYPDMTKSGLDPRVLDLVGVNPDSAVAYIRKEQPDYVTFESWVLEQNGGNLDQAAIEEWNTFLRTRDHQGEKRSGILAFVGLDDSGPTSAAVLNSIEDYQYAYRQLMDDA
ncbi:TPA: hypothetical protein DCE37_12155 [Candidatus Latescibacteria bacterium]|nr:hypothetical protein [Candidatus Latescibacterota bacterium]